MVKGKLIKDEFEKYRQSTYEDLVKSLNLESFLDIRAYFLYYVKAEVWEEHLANFVSLIHVSYKRKNAHIKREYLKLLVFLAIDLKSFVIEWCLAENVEKQVIEVGYKTILAELIELEKNDVDNARLAHEYFCIETNGRLLAEAIAIEKIPLELAKACGSNLEEFIDNTIRNISKSNIYQMSIDAKDNKSRMILSNDYGEYLNDTIWLGISYATTNPPLINMVWDIDREKWKSKLTHTIKEEIKDNSNKDDNWLSHVCSLATLIVVEKNCKLLRNIFLATSGNEGYVCYQVNPENHDNSEGMINEVHYVYKLMEKRLGGIPNVSFKLPGTSESLKTAKILSQEGISLTITLEFSIFQALEFAKVFRNGNAITSNLVVMNGRLAFPVRDELLENGISGAEEAAQWAGIEVTRKLYRKIYKPISEGGLGVDSRKVRIMNASLRIYENEIPDISELMGPQVMTIFPNVRRAWDSKDREYNYGSIDNKTPLKLVEILKKSEIFCQAFWVSEDENDGKPKRVLTMNEEDKNGLISWLPVQETLDQFLSSYRGLRKQVNLILEK